MNLTYQIAASRITVEDKAKIAECLREYYRKAKDKFGFADFSYTWQFAALGRTAGTAVYAKNKINLNPVLFTENKETFFSRTIPHELAHIITHHVYGIRRTGKGWDHHGADWQRVMRAMGLEPSRCHNMDTSNAIMRRQRKFGFTCTCGKAYKGISTAFRNKLAKGQIAASCARCSRIIAAHELSEQFR